MPVRIQHRRGTAAEWTAADTVLAEGELAVEIDTGKYKIGDGATAWTSLLYSSGGYVTEEVDALHDATVAAAAAAEASAIAAAASESGVASDAATATAAASSASVSASSASASAIAAAAVLDAFDDRYLGAKAVAPTLDNDGNALATGALYYDTALAGMYVWTGSAWTLSALAAYAIPNIDGGSPSAIYGDITEVNGGGV